MDLNLLSNTARQIGRTLSKNSPTILTALGITGFVSTVVMAVKATPKAVEILDHERNFRFDEYNTPYEEPINIQDTVELTWQLYAPATLMGITSIVCIIGAQSITNRRNVALTSLYSIAESTLKDYQAKVVQTIGDKKEQKIRSEIADDELAKHPMESKSIIVSGLGDTLCMDQYTGRFFKGDVEHIRKAVNDFNRQLLSDMRIPLNDLYSEIGLDPVESGQYVGWDIEKGLVEIDFSAKLASGNVPCVVLTFMNKPTKLW
jgi:hypothetical protein